MINTAPTPAAAVSKFKLCGHGKYFALNIHQRINERQHRNALNINFLFATVLRQSSYTSFVTEEPAKNYPPKNTGLYHHVGKKHSQYPKK